VGAQTQLLSYRNASRLLRRVLRNLKNRTVVFSGFRPNYSSRKLQPVHCHVIVTRNRPFKVHQSVWLASHTVHDWHKVLYEMPSPDPAAAHAADVPTFLCLTKGNEEVILSASVCGSSEE